MKKVKYNLYAIILIFLTGCASNPNYKGIVTDCSGNGLNGVKVEAWKNQWTPFHLPEKISMVITNDNGEFLLVSDKRVSFFVFNGNKINLQSHPKKSQSKCNNRK